MTEATASDAPSQLGLLYQKAYEALCGKHPYQRPWHFQYLVVLDTHRWLRAHLGSLRGLLLDVGCGDRPYEAWLRRGPDGVTKGVTKYVGLDIHRGPGVDIVVEPDTRWPVDDASIDSVLFSEVLEHVGGREFLMDEIARVLKPGGYLLLTVPFIYQVHGFPHDYARFTTEGVRRLFEKDYELLELAPIGRAGTSLATLFLAWIDTSMNSTRTTRLLKGVLLPLWIGLTLVINLLCLAVNALDRTATHYTQVGLLARRRNAQA